MSTPYIKLENIYYSINKREIISGLDLSINKEEFIAVTGENGCGKTTLTKLILGILKTESGNISIDNKDIKKYKLHEIGSKIGYVFQNPSYQIFAPTIEEELGYAMKYKGIDDETIKRKTEEMIDEFSLGDAREVTTYNLSQGEKRRLAIASMMLNNPEYIILDEPTVGLDAERKISLFEHLKKINSQGVGIMIISHDDKIVNQYVKRIIKLEGGRANEI